MRLQIQLSPARLAPPARRGYYTGRFKKLSSVTRKNLASEILRLRRVAFATLFLSAAVRSALSYDIKRVSPKRDETHNFRGTTLISGHTVRTLNLCCNVHIRLFLLIIPCLRCCLHSCPLRRTSLRIYVQKRSSGANLRQNLNLREFSAGDPLSLKENKALQTPSAPFNILIYSSWIFRLCQDHFSFFPHNNH